LLALCLFFAVALAHQFPNGAFEIVEDPRILFTQYKSHFHKSYSASEDKIRFDNFKASIARVNMFNERSQDAVFGITQFSDLSTEEFSTTILMKSLPIVPQKNTVEEVEIANVDVPTTFDWRNSGAVTPVKNQEQCGSCWAFSATESIESAYIIAGKATNTTINLAPQQLVDCDKSSDGCDGGWPAWAFTYLTKVGGQESNESYPYTGQDGKCSFEHSLVVASIAGHKVATSQDNETILQTNLVGWGPLSICLDATAWQDYSNGTMTHTQCGSRLDINHCVQLVGYDTNDKMPYWVVRNSWTDSWGMAGYINLQMWKNTCGLASNATWPNL